MNQLLNEIKNCTACKEHLALGPRPVVRANESARIAVIGQAPGTRVHNTGIPWNDPSGVQLRKWLNLSDEEFYDKRNLAIIPMGFCYPGKGKSGDLPPRPECAPKWHQLLWDQMPNIELFLLIGQYAQKYYLGKESKKTLTENVMHFEEFLPNFFALPHPSPRNRLWLKKNDWFEKAVVPQLEKRVHALLNK